MNGPFGSLLFGLGAGLASIVLRAASDAPPPDVRALCKDGIRAWKTIEEAAGAAQAEFDAFHAELRAELPSQTRPPQARRTIRFEPPASEE